MSNKKRRIEGLETPKSPLSPAGSTAVSAISALAARRRAASSVQVAVEANDSASDTDEKPAASNTNFYSPLHKIAIQNDSAKSPSKVVAKQSRPQRGSESSAIALKGVESPSGDLLKSAGSPAAVFQIIQYSSFRPTKRNHRIQAGGVVELRLEDSERFMILGSFGLRVIHGEVTIAGASLRPSGAVQWIHAPHCHAIPVLRSAEKTGVELHPDPTARGLRQLGRISPLFRKIWNEPVGASSKKRGSKEATFQILCTSEDAPKRCIIQDLIAPPKWNKKLASLVLAARDKPSLTTLVCGPKSAGKSTFSRLLTNRLLTDRSLPQSSKGVVILDLDPGQPEYAPAATLSLVHVTQPNVGAPFTHPGAYDNHNHVIRCHSLASVTPALDPDLYLACAIDLYDTYCKSSLEAPLIINTPGWILGTGLDLLSAVITKVKPDQVLYMSEDGPSDTVEVLRAATKTLFTALPSQQSEFTTRTAAHLRAMQTMSYFHLEAPTKGVSDVIEVASRNRWNPSPLSANPPWLIGYAPPHAGILGILSYDYQSPPELLAETINGMVLAAVEIEDPKAFRSLVREGVGKESTSEAMEVDTESKDAARPVVSTTPEGIPFIPNHDDIALDPRYSRTIGLVLIRGIDAENKTLQILTPISSKQISDIRSRGRDVVFVHGKFDTPSWAYTEDLYAQAGNDEGTEGVIEVTDEDISEDESDAEPEDVEKASDIGAVPWVEVLKRNERRPVGSRVWRVRRDLGRNAGD
ncbi:hypothetical protein G7046_g6472 [Stylonectria norvegica]|nr:hypothetical protein G7046_g6472 [Stylonectria norvegica]